MARNIEIKARVDDLEALRRRVAALTPTPATVLLQTDTFFVAASGRLKLRQFSGGDGELIFYDRPDAPGPKASSYIRSHAPEPATLSEILERTLGLRGIVEKRREVFMVGRSRIHLDEVRGLGNFMEIEVVLDDGEDAAVGEQVAHEIMTALEITETSLVAGAYVDLLHQPRGGEAGFRPQR